MIITMIKPTDLIEHNIDFKVVDTEELAKFISEQHIFATDTESLNKAIEDFINLKTKEYKND